MRKRRKQLAAALGGAVALAFGAYALGSQAGDGSAVAGGSSGSSTSGARPAHFGGPGGQGLADLADRLGVEQSALEDALREIRGSKQRGDRRDALADGLADKLGVDAGKVSEALQAQLPDRGERRRGFRRLRERFASALARELGVSTAKVTEALEDVRGSGNRPRDREAFVDALADELGVSEAKLRDALEEIRPDRPRWRRGPGLDTAALARAIGVDEDKLESALEELRAEHRAEHEKRRDEFAQRLANELGIPVERVKEELPAGPGPGGRHGP